MTNRNALGTFALLASALLPLTRATAQGGAPPPPAVRVAPVVLETVQERRQVTGNLRAASRARVAAPESGRIVAVEFDESKAVKEGDVLARIDDRRLQLDLAQAEADVEVSRAELEIRKIEARTATEDLNSYRAAAESVKGSVSALTVRAAERDAEVAASRVSVAERGLDRLRTRVDRLKIQLEDTIVRAPFDGRIVTRSVEPGEWVNAGDPVCTLVSTGRIEAWLEIPEQYSYSVLAETIDLEVRIETLETQMRVVSTRVVPDIEPRSRRYFLIADLDPGDTPLAPGMSVTAAVPSGRSAERVRVPTDAVMRDGGGYFLYKVVANGEGHNVIPVSVTPEFAERDGVYLSTLELTTGDRVVVEGNERLRPMSPIRITETQGAGPGEGR